MTGDRSDRVGASGACFESVPGSIRAVGLAHQGPWRRAIDPPGSLPGRRCEACGGDDFCLPRWEDDGGGMGPARAGLRPLPSAIDRVDPHGDVASKPSG